MTQRFERIGFEKWRPQPALDRETGQRVLLPPHPYGQFLASASIQTMAKRVQELDDERCARVVSIDPFAVVAPPEPAPTGTLEEWARAAVDCVDVVVRLGFAHDVDVTQVDFFDLFDRFDRIGRILGLGPG